MEIQALGYVGVLMLLMARPIMQYVFWRMFALDYQSVFVFVLPIAGAVVLSVVLTIVPLSMAERRLAALSESR